MPTRNPLSYPAPMRSFTVALLMLAGVCAWAQSSSRLPALDKLEGKAFDVAFISRVIALHSGSTELAAREVRFAKRTEAKEAARRVIVDNLRETKQLEDWLQSWYGQDADAAEVARVRSALELVQSDAFGLMTPMQGHEMPIDKAFLEALITYRLEIIVAARVAAAKASRAELRTYAKNALESRAREIEQYRAWLKAGF